MGDTTSDVPTQSEPVHATPGNSFRLRFGFPALSGVVLVCAVLFASVHKFGFSPGVGIAALLGIGVVHSWQAIRRRPGRTAYERILFAIAGIAGCAGAVLGMYVRLPDSRELAEARSASAYVRALRPELLNDSRFREVKLEVSTTVFVHIVVRGEVSTEDDLAALREKLDRARPPSGLSWSWTVQISETGEVVHGQDPPRAASRP